jgi:hypothetical protein
VSKDETVAHVTWYGEIEVGVAVADGKPEQWAPAFGNLVAYSPSQVRRALSALREAGAPVSRSRMHLVSGVRSARVGDAIVAYRGTPSRDVYKAEIRVFVSPSDSVSQPKGFPPQANRAAQVFGANVGIALSCALKGNVERGLARLSSVSEVTT